MNKFNVATIAVLLLSVLIVGGQTRTTLESVDGATTEAMEHQRILAELEEVHQLRERMLQEGKCTKSALCFVARCLAHCFLRQAVLKTGLLC